MIRHGKGSAAWVLALALWTIPASADANKKEAARLFSAGQQAFEKGEYLTAIRAFQQSYKVQAHPDIFFAMAQSYRKQFVLDRDVAKARKAVDNYRRFVKERPRSQWRPAANAHLVEMMAILVQQPPGQPAQPAQPPPTQIMVTSKTVGARIYLGDETAGQPAPAIHVVQPGIHNIRVEAPGFSSAGRQVQAMERRLVISEVNLVQLPGSIRVVASQSGATVFVDGRARGFTPFEKGGFRPGKHEVAVAGKGRKLWTGMVKVESDRTALAMADMGWSSQRKASTVTMASGATLLVAGLATGLLALQIDSSLSGVPKDSPDAVRAAHDDTVRERDNLALASTVLFSAAGAVLAAAAALYLFDTPAPPVAPDRARKGTKSVGMQCLTVTF